MQLALLVREGSTLESLAHWEHSSTALRFDAVRPAYQGPPRVALNLAGTACDSTGLFCRTVSSDPTIQSNLVAEQAKLNKSASPYKFYPVVSFGVGYRF